MMLDGHASDQLAAYLDGEIAGAGRARVEAHLERCAECRDELEQVRTGRLALRVLPLASAPADLWSSIEAAADTSSHLPLWRYAAAAAALVVLSGAYWMWSKQSTGSWQVIAMGGSPVAGSRPLSGTNAVRSGQWVETDAVSRARILVGSLGSVDVEPNSRVRLVATGASGYRLALPNGSIRASISAPPRLFVVDTPAGTAVDLGCEYSMECSRDGAGMLRVSAGWVALEWKGRDSLVPAGASCRMYPRLGPGTPWFDDARPVFIAALHEMDQNREGTLATVLAEARARDTLSLWHLLSRVDSGDRVSVYNRMAALAPPPSEVLRERVLALDPESLKRWKDELAWTW